MKSLAAAACLLAGVGVAALAASCAGAEHSAGSAPPSATTSAGPGATHPATGGTTIGEKSTTGTTTAATAGTSTAGSTTDSMIPGHVAAVETGNPYTPPRNELPGAMAPGGAIRLHHHFGSRPNQNVSGPGSAENIRRPPDRAIVAPPPVTPTPVPDVSTPPGGLDGDFGGLARAWRNLPTAQVTDTIKTIPAEAWRVGDRVAVTVAVAQKLTDQFKEQIAGQKAAELPVSPLKISPTMTAELTDESPTRMFKIEPGGPQESPVYYDSAHPGNLPPTVWEWGVTPLHAGSGVLKITVKAILRVGSLNQVQPVTSYQREVRVRINLAPIVVTRIRKISDDIIAAITAAVAAAIAAAIVTWLRHLFHKKKKDAEKRKGS